MTITCLIGNGFDLGLGLKTRYLDFLPWYLSRKSSKSDAVKWLCGQIENSKDGTWADAEMAFGRLPFSEAGEDAGKVVDDTLIDFQKDLAEYIHLQEGRLSIPNEDCKDVRAKFLASVVGALLLDVSSNAKGELSSVLYAQDAVDLNFITLNYTETLYNLLGRDVDSGAYSQVTIPGRARVTMLVGPICYVHGALKDHTSIFGVDTALQIVDQKARAHCATSGMLLKPTLDRLLDFGFEQQAKAMIYRSDRIVCLGSSYGASDVRWWEYIYDALTQNKNARLLLSPYFEENRSCESSAEQVVIAREVRNAFFGSIAEKKKTTVHGLPAMDSVRPRIGIMSHSPHYDFDGNVGYCDPFNLAWFGKKYVKDYGK